MKHPRALHYNKPLSLLMHTLYSQQAFKRKQQGTEYFPTGSPPFGAGFLPVSGCQTVSVFSFPAFRGTHTHQHTQDGLRPLGPFILFVMRSVIYCFPLHPFALLFHKKHDLQLNHEYFWLDIFSMKLIIHFSVSLLNRVVLTQCLHGREKSMASPLWPSRFWRKPTSVVVWALLPPNSLPATIPCCSTYRLGTLYCHRWVDRCYTLPS